MSNTELKPCPFCGCCDVQDDLSLNAFICDDCGAVGPESPVDGDYAAAWNTRPAPVVKDLVWVDVLLGGSLMADTDLKPCPWCNELPKMQPAQDGSDYEALECCNDQCPVNPATDYLPYPEVVAVWNTRVDLAPMVKPGEIAKVVEDAFCDLDLADSDFLSTEKAEDIERRILSALSLAPVAPEQAAEVLLNDTLSKLTMAASVTASVVSDYPSLRVVEEALEAIKGEGK